MGENAIVYVVDDDESLRNALESLLRSVGIAARTYNSVQDLLDSAQADGPGCLVLDVRLPGLSGLVHIGTVDRIESGRIKLTKADSGQGSHEGHRHYISLGLVATVEEERVRLSANGDVAVQFEEERDA